LKNILYGKHNNKILLLTIMAFKLATRNATLTFTITGKDDDLPTASNILLEIDGLVKRVIINFIRLDNNIVSVLVTVIIEIMISNNAMRTSMQCIFNVPRHDIQNKTSSHEIMLSVSYRNTIPIFDEDESPNLSFDHEDESPNLFTLAAAASSLHPLTIIDDDESNKMCTLTKTIAIQRKEIATLSATNELLEAQLRTVQFSAVKRKRKISDVIDLTSE
jgi:hypothetical protein